MIVSTCINSIDCKTETAPPTPQKKRKKNNQLTLYSLYYLLDASVLPSGEKDAIILLYRVHKKDQVLGNHIILPVLPFVSDYHLSVKVCLSFSMF